MLQPLHLFSFHILSIATSADGVEVTTAAPMSHKLIYYGQIFSVNKMENPFSYGIEWQSLIFITNQNLLNHIKKDKKTGTFISNIIFQTRCFHLQSKIWACTFVLHHSSS